MKTRTLIIGAAVLLVVAGGGYFLLRPSAPPAPRTAAVSRGDVVQDVVVTGKVESTTSAGLGFEYSGTITDLHVATGDQVTAGQLLASIDSATASLESQKATADTASGQEKAKIVWDDAVAAWNNTKAENTRKLEEARQVVRDTKEEMDHQKAVWQQTVSENGDEAAATKAVYQTFLAKQTAYRAAQQDLTTLLKTVAKTNNAAEAAATQAQASYRATVQAGPNTAGTSSLEALQGIAHIKLAKTAIRAPFDGTVTRIIPEIGEVVAAGSSVITLETPESLQLVADIAETDAAKLTVGNDASVTFDALPADYTASATVTTVDPAAVFLEGVPTYRTTLSLPAQDSRLRPGMTANITIHAARAAGTLFIPQQAVTLRDGKTFVSVLQADDTIDERAVTQGLVGSEGYVEITSGLSEGEQVVIEIPTS